MEERLVSRQIFIPMPEAEIHLLNVCEYIYIVLEMLTQNGAVIWKTGNNINGNK